MANNKMWHSAVRSSGDLAGVFEYDGETGYFYLYHDTAPPGRKIAGAIHIISGTPDFLDDDIAIRWASSETVVGLFIHSKLWAVFDANSGVNYGGNYCPGGNPNISASVAQNFI